MDIGALIKEKRLEHQMTLEDLAKKIGVSPATISRWETGQIGDMKRSRIKALSEALDIPVHVIMGWDEPEELYAPGSYYHDPAAAEIAEFLHKNPHYKVLFDASRRVAPEDIDFVRQMIERTTKEG